MLSLSLASLFDTEALGCVVASCVVGGAPHPPLLLHGQLGAGKTTFVRAVVSGLPGCEEAEVCSPSFNLLNLYPTRPEVGHFDLYRTGGSGLDEDLEEILLDPRYFCVVEWAEFLPRASRPASFVEMWWSGEGEQRVVDCRAQGREALAFMDCVAKSFAS